VGCGSGDFGCKIVLHGVDSADKRGVTLRILPSDTPLDRMLSRELARRVQYGWLLHILIVGFISFGTTFGPSNRLISGIFLSLIVLLGLLRFGACRRTLYSTDNKIIATVPFLYAFYLTHTLCWTLFTGYIFITCFGKVQIEAIMVICLAGVTSSASNILAPSPFLSYSHFLVQMAVASVWCYYAREHFGWLIFLVCLAYVAWESMVIRLQSLHIREMFEARLRLETYSEELTRARDLAEETASSRVRFLANMSHEIRTPLNGILGLAHILRETPLNAAQTEMFDTLFRSGEHLRNIVDDILDFSKVSAGRLELEQIPFDLHQLLSEVTDSIYPLANEKGLRLRVEIDPGVARHLQGDPLRLRQVILNLLSNAVKFTADGIVTLSCQPGRLSGSLRIAVQDTGIGIASEDLPFLFQDFTQVDASTKRRFGGTGLGLAISRDLVDLMGGEISVRSKPGEGSCFAFEIPLLEAVDGVPEQAGPPIDTADYTLPQDFRILVAEDNPVNLRIAETLLEKTGAVIETATNGASAVAMQAKHPYDLIFMDCNMPEMDGYEATAAIRALPGVSAKTPIIALTANALSEDRARCLAAGMDEHLAKPIRRESLFKMVHRFVPSRATSSNQLN
jgi:signal transduction histidine kinase/ActR/RegA family two-component response regulator